MIVPLEILHKLKCANCENLLSCGPVVLKTDGSNICGRCSNLEETATANAPYNELAALCDFPCKYEEEGCNEKVTFSCIKEHEANCEFRSYICPVMPSGSCEWIGPKNKILEHTQDAHPEKILPHPCEMQHDVKTASLKTFLTNIFDVLFLVQTKVCLTTYTIYHSVRKFGELSDDCVFKYELTIKSDCGSLKRKSEVAPQGCLALQEDSSIAVKINALMEALNGFKNSTFRIKIQKYLKCEICNQVVSAEDIEVYDEKNNIFYCKPCSLTLGTCKNLSSGCKWKGLLEFVYAHEKLLCPLTKWCDICNKNIKEKNMLNHVEYMKHTICDIKHMQGSFRQINIDITDEIATYKFKNITYLFSIKNVEKIYVFRIIGIYNEVNKYKCNLFLRNPKTQYFSIYSMKPVFKYENGLFSWKTNLQLHELKPFINDNKFEVDIDIMCRE